MNVLVIGNGGREHAMAWKLAQSSRTERVFVAPGNAGTEQDAENIDIPADDFTRLIRFAKDNQVGLTVVGPEAPLASGIVDAFSLEGQRVFGPSREAAELEASKVFCKDLLHKADVASAEYRTFQDVEEAVHYIDERYPNPNQDVPIVVKADGLAAGKGVVVCHNRADALDAIERIASHKEFGEAGNQFVIEERLSGEEVSVLAVTDGTSILMLPPAQDHKPAHDGDQGPNTGGMGAYCPAPILSEEMLGLVEEKILVPTVHAMKRSRRPFSGILYAGLMITHQGPKVLEYNVRFGDPECQPLLARLKSDLLDVFEATLDGKLQEISPLQWDPRPAICVVMASDGYPGSYERGKPIRGLDDAEKLTDVKVFHAGTAIAEGEVVTNGGRVLGVTALGNSISAAKLQAYKGVKCIRWDGAWCRKDISDKALKHL